VKAVRAQRCLCGGECGVHGTECGLRLARFTGARQTFSLSREFGELHRTYIRTARLQRMNGQHHGLDIGRVDRSTRLGH
jgi:hypothetical protein